MFGIPEWAIGVCVIFGFTAVLMWLVPPDRRRRPFTSDQPQIPHDLQTRLGELDELKQRLGELEERVDFAERLLAKQREGQRLAPPS